ncbi:MAG: chitobiase/beta-hexosaminidase C-terminal domain-containing protein, partial [Bacteroides sp.]
FSIYKSLRLDFQDNPIDLEKVSKDKLQLKEEAKDHILGMQVQLFSETIRDFDAVEYFVFPKMLGLVERAWNAHPAWEHLTGAEEQKVYNEDLSLFYAKLSDLELPYLESLGVNFRLPHPGIEVKEGLVYLNTPLRHASIRYTLDGTEPTASSPLWTEAVAVQAGQEVKAKLFFGSKESLTSFFTVK